MKQFKKNDKFREISTHNYLALEQFLNEFKVAYVQCKLANDYEADNGRSDETNELICRGLNDLEVQLHNIQTWYSCVSSGIDIDY